MTTVRGMGFGVSVGAGGRRAVGERVAGGGVRGRARPALLESRPGCPVRDRRRAAVHPVAGVFGRRARRQLARMSVWLMSQTWVAR